MYFQDGQHLWGWYPRPEEVIWQNVCICLLCQLTWRLWKLADWDLSSLNWTWRARASCWAHLLEPQGRVFFLCSLLLGWQHSDSSYCSLCCCAQVLFCSCSHYTRKVLLGAACASPLPLRDFASRCLDLSVIPAPLQILLPNFQHF